jgi:antitoxin component YwqK of YwqJK toxin-antitoxin module
MFDFLRTYTQRILLIAFFIVGFSDAYGQSKELIQLAKTSYTDITDKKPSENGVSDRVLIQLTDTTDLDRLASNLTDKKALHIIWPSVIDSTLKLDALSKLTSLRILTFSFPKPDESHGFPKINSPYIDLSFLSKLTNLEILVIDWPFHIVHEDAILHLDHLIYASLPVTAFSPCLLSDKSSVIQFDFNSQDRMTLTRTENQNPLVLDRYEYENQFSSRNRKYAAFLKSAKKMQNSKVPWAESYLKTTVSGDTIFYMSTKNKENLVWKIQSTSGRLDGAIVYQNDQVITHRTITSGSSRKQSYISSNNEIRLLEEQLASDGKSVLHTEEYGYKNGMMHGFFTKLSNNLIYYKAIYNEGKLEYQYPYTDSLPDKPRFHQKDFSNQVFHREAFFSNGKLSLIKGYSENPHKSDAVLLQAIPFKNNKVSGMVVELNYWGDTLVKANFSDGILNGPYYSLSVSHGDTVRVFQTFQNGKIFGERRVIRKYSTTTSWHEDDRILLLTTIRADGTMVEKNSWIPEKNHYECTTWLPNGKVASKRIIDSNGKVISQQQFYEEKPEYLEP